MLLDLFDNSNSIIINYKSIQVFGLSTAVYLTELLNIFKKAAKKNKLINDVYFRVDRNYITKILSLSVEEQLICDLNLIKLNLLKKSSEDPDILTIDVNLYISIIAENDLTLYDDIRKQVKVKKPKGIAASNRQIIIKNLKDSIDCPNYELLTALRNWVDGVYAKPGAFLSKKAIELFQKNLNDYTKGDIDLALRLVNIATIQGYKDCQWAINILEKDEKVRKSANNLKNNNIRVTEQKVADKNDLSDIIF